MDETVLSLGKRAEEERLRIGRTQEDLAEFCGVTRRTISRIENEKTPPSGDILTKFSQLGIDVQFVLTGVRSKNLDAVAEEAGSYNADPQGVGAVSREEQKIIEMYRKLRPPERTRLREIFNWLVSAKVKKDDTGSG